MDSRYVFHLLGFCCASRRLISRSQDKNYFESTHFPKIFVALNGHMLEISIAVCLQTVVWNGILSLNMRDNIFVATLLGKKEAPTLVVKLVKRYSKEAHEHLANKGLAPKLFVCQRVIGNLIAVVMERVTGNPLHIEHRSLTASKQILVFNELKRAITELGNKGLVHGDLRGPNIVV